jgi:hypothetical protein
MQYFALSRGKARWKSGYKARAIGLFTAYAIYILVFAVGSAMGFFLGEIQIQEQSMAKTSLIETVNQKRMNQISVTIDNLNKQLSVESNTGYGQKTEAIMNEIAALTTEQSSLKETVQKSSNNKINVSKNVFQSLGQVFGVSENLLKVLVFGTSILMLYLCLILTSWDLDTEESKKVIMDRPKRNDAIETLTADIIEEIIMPKNSQIEPQEEIKQEIKEELTKEEVVETEKPQETDELKTFIDALFDTNSKRLNGNKKIVEATKLSFYQCNKYRELLARLIINGEQVFQIVKGATKCEFSKEDVWEELKNQVLI